MALIDCRQIKLSAADQTDEMIHDLRSEWKHPPRSRMTRVRDQNLVGFPTSTHSLTEG